MRQKLERKVREFRIDFTAMCLLKMIVRNKSFFSLMLLVTDSSLCLQVNYLQNDNALLENKQKELKGTIQSLVQSRESFINAYEVCIFLTFLRPHAGCCFILLEDKRMKMGRLVKKWYNTSWTRSKEVGYRDRIPKVSMKRGVAISAMYKELTLWSIWSPASRHLKQLKLMKAIAEYTKRLWIWSGKSIRRMAFMGWFSMIT